MSKHYLGPPCPRCGNKLRYVKSKRCVECVRKKIPKSNGISNAPEQPKRAKNWPKKEARDGTIIQADPIYVMMGGR